MMSVREPTGGSMVHISRRHPGEDPALEPTPESAYLDRRAFLKTLGLAGAGLVIGGAAAGVAAAERAASSGAAGLASAGSTPRAVYPARRSPRFTLDRPLTDERVAATHNNFYEFTEEKSEVWRRVDKFRARPWRIEIAGLVSQPREIDVDDLIRRLPSEERLYRHRCVEAWAMAVPWTGV